MITKEEFTEYINEFQNLEQAIDRMEEAIDRMEEAISDLKYGCNLWESDWYGNVSKMLDIFIDSHFTDNGSDLINYFLFESVDDKLVTIKKEKDIFNEEQEIEYHLNSIDELWDFLLTDIKLYFKNV